MNFLKQKTLWLGWIGVLAVVLVFGLAMMGSVLGAKPKALPVGIVVADEGATLPNGEALHVGKMLQSKLAELEGLPIDWIEYESEAAATAGIDDRSVYGALLLPADLSAGVLSAASPSPSPGEIRIVVNEGMNAQGSGLAKQALGQLVATFRTELTKQAMAMAAARSEAGAIPAEAALAMLTPFTVIETTAHPIGANQGNGAAPGMLVQIVWMSAMVSAIVLFLSANRAVAAGDGRWTAVMLQAAFGIATMAAASGFLVWSAVSWYGMELSSA
ncbi:MAG TPA: ABC transporter permease, partial [Paenibacillus sp.]|nr:ABC transporter permease [Paenibacillus sp.]